MGETLMQQRRVSDDGLRVVNLFRSWSSRNNGCGEGSG